MNDKHDRTAGIGGSDAAAALGLSPWKTQYALWREKRGLDTHDDIGKKPAVEWGRLLENVIADKFADVASLTVQRVNGTLCNAAFPWMYAHIDRAVVNPNIAKRVVWNGKRLTTDAILEAKTASGYSASQWGDEGTDQVPIQYAAQAAHYLAVTGVAVVHFGVLFDGRTFKRYMMQRDEDLMERVIEGEREFWTMVQDNIEPEAVSIEDARAKYARSEEVAIEATEEIALHVAHFAALKARHDSDAEAAKVCQLEIMKYMGAASSLTIRGVPAVTWRTAKDSRVFDVEAFAQDHPAQHELYLRTRDGSRRMIVK